MTRNHLRTTIPALLAGIVLLLGLGASPASAHASLESTSPADGANVDAIDEVSLTFNEAASVPAGGLRVFDAEAERVDTGQVRSIDDTTAVVGLEPDLPDGAYIVTWRAVSVDGHPIRGAFVFSIGDGAAADDALVAQLFGAGGGDAAVGLAGGIVRAFGYTGALLAAGALAYLLWVARDDRERGRAATWTRRGAIVGAVAALLTVPLQSMAVTGFGPVEALGWNALGPILSSATGYTAVVRLVALVAVLVTVRRSAMVAGGAAAVALLSFVLDGHTRTVEPGWLLLSADLVHVVTAALWFGGLAVLVAALRDRSFDDDPVSAAGLVARYSSLATWSVVAVTIAGSAMSWALVRQPRALTSTAYGWTLVAKLLLAGAVIAIGVLNNRRLVPAIATAARVVPSGGSTDAPAGTPPTATTPAAARAGWDRLRKVTRVEVGLMVAVIAVTAFLVNLRPAAEAAGITGVFETTQAVTDELTLNLVVDPNRAGDNQIHLYLLDQTGRPARSDAVESVVLELSLPDQEIGPIERETFVAGPGHWQLNGSELSIAGDWVIDVVVRIDRFTEQTVSVPVTVNPS